MRVISAMLFVIILASCAHWDMMRYRKMPDDSELGQAVFRLDVGWNHVSTFEDTHEQQEAMKEMLEEHVDQNSDCIDGRLTNFEFGAYEGGGVLWVSAECSLRAEQEGRASE